MTLQTLPYCPKPGYTVESEPKRKATDFGDGYQQRRVGGLNPLLRVYQLTFNLKHSQAVKLTAFFTQHGGVTAFQFRDRGKLVKVVCPKWSETSGKTHTEITCTFEEVV